MIRFYYGTQTAYDSLEIKDSDVLYCITDTMRIYKGTDLISNSCTKFVETVPTAETTVSGNLYVYVVEGQAPSLYVKVGSEVVQISGTSSVPTIDEVLEQTSGRITQDYELTKSSGVSQYTVMSGDESDLVTGFSGAIIQASTEVGGASPSTEMTLTSQCLEEEGSATGYISMVQLKSPAKESSETSAGIYLQQAITGENGYTLDKRGTLTSDGFTVEDRINDVKVSTSTEGFFITRKIDGTLTSHKALTGDLEDTLVSGDQVNMRTKLDVYSKSEVDNQIDAITQTLSSLNISVAEI